MNKLGAIFLGSMAAYLIMPSGVKADEYTGSYFCSQGETSLRLSLNKKNGKASALFSFDNQQKGVSGEFLMTGGYSGNDISLVGGEWIRRPRNYVTVNLSGSFTSDGGILSGTVEGPGCSKFSLRRTSVGNAKIPSASDDQSISETRETKSKKSGAEMVSESSNGCKFEFETFEVARSYNMIWLTFELQGAKEPKNKVLDNICSINPGGHFFILNGTPKGSSSFDPAPENKRGLRTAKMRLNGCQFDYLFGVDEKYLKYGEHNYADRCKINRKGDFVIFSGQPQVDQKKRTWGASCVEGGFAAVTVFNEYPNNYTWQSHGFPGGTYGNGVGTGVENALKAACKGG